MKFVRPKLLAMALTFVAICVSAAIGLSFWAASTPIINGANSKPRLIAQTSDLYDLGVADINGDRFYDIFTVNHSNWQEILVSREDGTYENMTLSLGLIHSLAFPAVERGLDPPQRAREGLYIFWRQGRLILHCIGNLDAEGYVTLPRKLGVEAEGGASFTPAGEGRYRFEMPGDSTVTLYSWDYYFTPSFEIGESLPLERVYVGSLGASPSVRSFALPERDRHAMAWADYNDDGHVDVFIVRGGDQGRLAASDLDANNELLAGTGSRFVDRTDEAGLVKGGLPGRVTAWVDANADGLLDLFIGNGRVEQPNRDAPNQVFVQEKNGRFVEDAAKLGLDTPGQGVGLWMDANNDSLSDLLWANAETIRLFVNESGQRFRETLVAKVRSEPKQMTRCDFDNDGDSDVFVASNSGNLLLVNEDGEFEDRSVESLGLPRASFAANWVDIDNDGEMELHTLPQGVFKRTSDGKFEATGRFALRKSPFISERKVISTWFDYDNDGDRDLLVSFVNPRSAVRSVVERAFQSPDVFRPLIWDVYIYDNDQPGTRNWLQITLRGPSRNRPAIGARVEVLTDAATYMQEVGSAEGSMQSQGHYRMYFGLGEAAEVRRIGVTWPSGETQVVQGISANALWEISYDDWKNGELKSPDES